LRWDITDGRPTVQGRILKETYVGWTAIYLKPCRTRGQYSRRRRCNTDGIVPVRYHHVVARLGLAWNLRRGKTSIQRRRFLLCSLFRKNWNQPSHFEPFATSMTFKNTGAGKICEWRLAYRYTIGDLKEEIQFPYKGLTHLAAEFWELHDLQWPTLPKDISRSTQTLHPTLSVSVGM